MSSNYKYDWGQTVRVLMSAPKEMRPGEVCSVCGIRESESDDLYLVEFSEGNAIEIPERELEPIEDS